MAVQSGGIETVYSAIRPVVEQRRVRGCLRGGCGHCQIHLLAGKVVRLGPMSANKVQPDVLGPVRLLACRVAAATDLVIEFASTRSRLVLNPGDTANM